MEIKVDKGFDGGTEYCGIYSREVKDVTGMNCSLGVYFIDGKLELSHEGTCEAELSIDEKTSKELFKVMKRHYEKDLLT